MSKGIPVSWVENPSSGLFDFSFHLNCSHIVKSLDTNTMERSIEKGFEIIRYFITCPHCLLVSVHDLLNGTQAKTEYQTRKLWIES